MKKYVVLLPCYNEAVTIKKVIEDFQKYLPSAKIYVFDNNSSDNTAEIAEKAGATVVKSTLQGKGNVIQHMFTVVESADAYIMVDGDDTYPVEELSRLMEKFHETCADMLVGVRLHKFEDESFRIFHQFGNKLVSGLISFLFNYKIQDVLSGYRIFSENYVKSVPIMSKGFEVETEMTLQAISKNYKVVEETVHYRSRPEGSYSKLNTYTDGFLVLKSIMLLLKNYKPIVFYGMIAAILALISIALGSFPIYEFVTTGFVKRVPTAILASSVAVLSVLVFSIGLILDTCSRYYLETFQQIKKKQMQQL